MAILVTGGAGYIGSHMVLELLDRDEDVVVVDNLSTGFRWLVPKGAPLIECDIADRDTISKVIADYSVDEIIHFAGSIIVPESVENPLKYYHNNTCASQKLLAAAVEGGVSKFIFSSTAAVYGNPAQIPVPETAPTVPVSPYGTSKRMTELMLADVSAAHDLNFVALRYFNVAGADPSGRSGQSTMQATHLIKVACEAALGRRAFLQVFGTDYETRDGSCVRDYIHVTDLARAHVCALNYLRGGGRSDVFNCGYSTGTSVLEVIETVKRVSGVNFEVKMCERRPGDPASIVAASEKIRETLEWSPKFDDIETIVQHALDWESRLSQMKKAS